MAQVDECALCGTLIRFDLANDLYSGVRPRIERFPQLARAVWSRATLRLAAVRASCLSTGGVGFPQWILARLLQPPVGTGSSGSISSDQFLRLCHVLLDGLHLAQASQRLPGLTVTQHGALRAGDCWVVVDGVEAAMEVSANDEQTAIWASTEAAEGGGAN